MPGMPAFGALRLAESCLRGLRAVRVLWRVEALAARTAAPKGGYFPTAIPDVSARAHFLAVAAKDPEISFIDQVLDAWSYWALRTGIKLRATPAAEIFGIKRVLEARYHLDLSEDEFILVDKGIAKLLDRFRVMIDAEYFEGGSAERKGRGLGLTRIDYRNRLYGAQCSVWTVLQPHASTWYARIR